jgi:hypothetical protein
MRLALVASVTCSCVGPRTGQPVSEFWLTALFRGLLPLSWKALNYGRRSGGHWFRGGARRYVWYASARWRIAVTLTVWLVSSIR